MSIGLDPDERLLERLVSALQDTVSGLSSALCVHAEALEVVGSATDKSISGDLVLFSRTPAVRSHASVVLRADLFAELKSAGHPATRRAVNTGEHTVSDVLIEDEGRGWLRLYELVGQDQPQWDLLVPFSHVDAVFSAVVTESPASSLTPPLT